MAKKTKSNRIKVLDQEGLDAFAFKLREIRKKKNYSQEQLALESGLSTSQIGRLETGTTNATISTIFRIARTLDVNVGDLFDFKLKKYRE